MNKIDNSSKKVRFWHCDQKANEYLFEVDLIRIPNLNPLAPADFDADIIRICDDRGFDVAAVDMDGKFIAEVLDWAVMLWDSPAKGRFFPNEMEAAKRYAEECQEALTEAYAALEAAKARVDWYEFKSNDCKNQIKWLMEVRAEKEVVQVI